VAGTDTSAWQHGYVKAKGQVSDEDRGEGWKRSDKDCATARSEETMIAIAWWRLRRWFVTSLVSFPNSMAVELRVVVALDYLSWLMTTIGGMILVLSRSIGLSHFLYLQICLACESLQYKKRDMLFYA